APRGAWTNFDVHVKSSDDPSVAVTDVYVNGGLTQHITEHPNEYTGYFNYFLTGWYRASDSQAQVVYVDNARRGASLADVQPATTSTSSTTASPVTAGTLTGATTTAPVSTSAPSTTNTTTA